MEQDHYEMLRQFVDQYNPLGFPKTESGLEWKLLSYFYSPEAAKAVIHLTMMPESPEAIGARMGKTIEETEKMLQMLEDGGLILSVPAGASKLYSAIPFAPGVIELNIHRLKNDAEISKIFFDYVQEGWGGRITDGAKLPFTRSLLVSESVAGGSLPLPHESIDELLAKVARPIVVTDCYCKTLKKNAGEPCAKPKEVCFYFGPFGAHYLDKGIGREVDEAEFRRIVKEGTVAGLVPMVCNAASFEDQVNMCMCCSCCCAFFGTMNRLSDANVKNAVASTHFFATVDADVCTGCGTCLDRCQVNAIFMDDNVAGIKNARCIGCGLCVSICPVEAISLQERELADRAETAGSLMELYTNLHKERSAAT